jgi:hypothetical protein
MPAFNRPLNLAKYLANHSRAAICFSFCTLSVMRYVTRFSREALICWLRFNLGADGGGAVNINVARRPVSQKLVLVPYRAGAGFVAEIPDCIDFAGHAIQHRRVFVLHSKFERFEGPRRI